MLNSISLGTIPKMAQIFLDNVDTNGSLTVNNLAWFAKEAIVGGLSMENVHFMTLPNRGASVYSRTYHNYQSYVTPIPDEMLELVLSTHAAVEKASRTFDAAAHHKLARRAAAESIVLLRNEGGILPLKPNEKLAVIGDFAETPRYQAQAPAPSTPSRSIPSLTA